MFSLNIVYLKSYSCTIMSYIIVIVIIGMAQSGCHYRYKYVTPATTNMLW